MTRGIHYETLGPNRGRLLRGERLMTPITGYAGEYNRRRFSCRLAESGELIVDCGSEWDFSTGAVNTPGMVYASLWHDAFCYLTDAGAVPWEVRKQADALFKRHLAERELSEWPGATWRLWQYPLFAFRHLRVQYAHAVVRGYSTWKGWRR